jgi:hypothetical protein
MDLVNKLGLMVLNTQVSGVKIEHTARVNSSTSTVTFMMDFGQMIKQTVQEFTSM